MCTVFLIVTSHYVFAACSVHGVELANIQFDDVVVISGCGPVGMIGFDSLQKTKKGLMNYDLYIPGKHFKTPK